MNDLLSIGLTGLRSSQTSLTVTGHNISNINTPGYSRQQTVQETGVVQYRGVGYFGSGSQVVDVRRLASEFLLSQVNSATSQSSELNTFRQQLEQLDALLSDKNVGANPALQRFFATLQTAAARPASSEGREALLAEAKGLSKTFNTLYDQLDSQNTLANQQISTLAKEINTLAQNIAGYNDAISKSTALGMPNDLIDAREEAIRKLSEMIGVQVIRQDDTSVSLFVGSGQPLVVGTTTSALQVVPGTNDSTRFQVELVTNGVAQNITKQISGGQMGGLLAYRDTALDTSYNRLGQVALVFAQTINQQLGQGLDLAGRPGSNLFADINDLAVARYRVLPQVGNQSNLDAQLRITNTYALTDSDYRLSFDGTNFSAYRINDTAPINVTVSGAGPYTLSFADANGEDQGFQVTLDNLPVAGDVFTLQPTRRGAADIKNQDIKADQLAFAGTARSQSGLNNRGTGTISQPRLTSGPSPVLISDLQSLFGSNGLQLTYDQTSNTLTSTLPAGASLSYVSPSTTALVPGQTNTLRLDYLDPVSGNNYSYEFTLTGVPQAADNFTLSFNSKGISDNSNALALSALQSKPTVGGIGSKGATYSDAYAGLVERVGTLTAQVRYSAEAGEAVLKQAEDNRDSLSGVNLDEEAANLIQFQQYYSASAQVIQVAKTLFDTLINTFR